MTYTSYRSVTIHGYRCPICRKIIEELHDEAHRIEMERWEGPLKREEKGFEVIL